MTKALDAHLKNLVPGAVDRTLVANRKRQIESILEDAGLSVVTMFEAGSFSHGTGIAQKSDVDLMIWLSYGQATDLPSSILRRVKDALRDANQYDYGLPCVSSPTVLVPYHTPPKFEIVPAFYESGSSTSDGTFKIPGRRDEWVLSSPGSHNRYVADVNKSLNARLKPLIRLVKAWKYAKDVPVSSFYLEMRTTNHMEGDSYVLYDLDLPSTLRHILATDVADMNDPTGSVGRIPACSSEDNRAATRAKLRSAINALEKADECRRSGDWQGYWYQMYLVFGTNFPYLEG